MKYKYRQSYILIIFVLYFTLSYSTNLRVNKEALDSKHPDTLESINKQAILYYKQGRYGDAEPLFIKCLKLSEEVLGPKHPNTLSSINNLAALFDNQGRYGDAEPLYIKCLKLSEGTMGSDLDWF